MAITLGDVVTLLGLPVEGNPLSDGERYYYMQLSEELLDLAPSFEQTRGNEIVELKCYR